MKIIKDKDGTWEKRGLVSILVKPSAAFEAKREQDRIQAEIAQAERDAVQAERDRCIAYLKKQSDLTKVNLADKGFSEAALEMSFEDIIESVRANREAELREI